MTTVCSGRIDGSQRSILQGLSFGIHPFLSYWAVCKIGYPSETHLQLKSRDISFVHYISFSRSIIKFFCLVHDNDTAVPCAKCQDDSNIQMDVLNDGIFAKFEFKMRFGQISYIEQHPWWCTYAVLVMLDFKNGLPYLRQTIFRPTLIYIIYSKGFWCHTKQHILSTNTMCDLVLFLNKNITSDRLCFLIVQVSIS